MYEGADRFAEVLEILEQKYGPRLVDVEPVGTSGPLLYGDSLSNIGRVKEMRRELKARSVDGGEPEPRDG